jgi:thioredoxin-like negative regulator of GroEL
MKRIAQETLLTWAAAASLLSLSACTDVIYRADDKVSGSNFTNDDADVAELQRRVAAGDEEARYDLAEYYISNGRYDEAEELGVIIENDEYRDRKDIAR